MGLIHWSPPCLHREDTRLAWGFLHPVLGLYLTPTLGTLFPPPQMAHRPHLDKPQARFKQASSPTALPRLGPPPPSPHPTPLCLQTCHVLSLQSPILRGAWKTDPSCEAHPRDCPLQAAVRGSSSGSPHPAPHPPLGIWRKVFQRHGSFLPAPGAPSTQHLHGAGAQ